MCSAASAAAVSTFLLSPVLWHAWLLGRRVKLNAASQDGWPEGRYATPHPLHPAFNTVTVGWYMASGTSVAWLVPFKERCKGFRSQFYVDKVSHYNIIIAENPNCHFHLFNVKVWSISLFLPLILTLGSAYIMTSPTIIDCTHKRKNGNSIMLLTKWPKQNY